MPAFGGVVVGALRAPTGGLLWALMALGRAVVGVDRPGTALRCCCCLIPDLGLVQKRRDFIELMTSDRSIVRFKRLILHWRRMSRIPLSDTRVGRIRNSTIEQIWHMRQSGLDIQVGVLKTFFIGVYALGSEFVNSRGTLVLQTCETLPRR